MLLTIEIARGISASLWLLVLLGFAGSTFRTFTKHSRHLDKTWSIAWFFSFLQVGYYGRWILGFAHSPIPGADFASLLGLNVLSAMIAAVLLNQRIVYGEHRW